VFSAGVGPPMEAGMGADGGGLGEEFAAALRLHGLQGVEIGAVLVDERRIRQGPEAFGGLECRGVRR